MALQRVEGPGIDPVCEGTAAFPRNHCSVQRVLESLDLFERKRVSLVEKATGNLQVHANQLGRIKAKFREPLSLNIINGNQIRQPMDTLENDPCRSGRQKCRCRLRGEDASPDENIERLWCVMQQFFDHRIKN